LLKQFVIKQPKRYYFPYDKEHLYAEAMKLKNSMNGFKNKNTQLRTQLAQYGKELEKKDKIIHELLGKVSSQPNTDNTKPEPTHLANALRGQIKVTQDEIVMKNKEIEKLNKNLKTTKLLEINIEIKMFTDEATRLKHIIEEILKQKAASYTHEDIEAIQGKINQQNYLIENIKQQNESIKQMLGRKEEEVSNWKNVYEKLQSKLNKLESESKVNTKSRVQLGDLKKEIQSLKAQIAGLKMNSKDKAGVYRSRIEELLKKEVELNEKLEQKNKKIKALEAKLETTSKDSDKLQELMRLRDKLSDRKVLCNG
jgi:chromosome segregation ATPase